MWSALGTLLGGALMGAGSLGGSAIGAASSDRAAKLAYDAQQETNQLNYQMAMENRAWLTKMANTAHQREVSDLRAAGLNPILSAMGGSGAAVPQMAAPVATSPGSPVADKSAILQGAVTGFLNSFGTAAEVADKLTKLQDNLAKADETKTKGELNKSLIKRNEWLNKLTEKQLKLEVGKQNPYQIFTNAITNPDARSALGESWGALKDCFSMLANQVKVFQNQVRYDRSPAGHERKAQDWIHQQKRDSDTLHSPTSARPIRLEKTDYGYRVLE